MNLSRMVVDRRFTLADALLGIETGSVNVGKRDIVAPVSLWLMPF